jgi:hypothetical protein
LALSVLLGVIVTWAVWSRRDTKFRAWSFIGFLTGLPVSAAIIFVNMGWSTPCKYSTYTPYGEFEYEILGYQAIPETIIYLFIHTRYGPKTCSLPWSNSTAEKLKEGLAKGGNGSKLKGKSAWSMPGDPNVWNPPPEALGAPKAGEV